MSRLDCLNGTQRSIIEQALRQYPDLNSLASTCGVHPRTLRDWHREKHRMSYEAFQQLRRRVKTPMPQPLTILPEFWHMKRAARLGGQRR